MRSGLYDEVMNGNLTWKLMTDYKYCWTDRNYWDSICDKMWEKSKHGYWLNDIMEYQNNDGY